MKLFQILASLSLLGLAAHAQPAEAPEPDWTAINLAVTDQHVLPGYQFFASSAAMLAESARGLCLKPDAASLANTQLSFHQAMDAWEEIQHIQFGPVTYFNWNFRLQYWPDEKGTGARQLDDMIAIQDTSSLETETFARQSVGVQGFPALERLLFEDNSVQLLQQDAYRCQVLSTIAANINDIAAGISMRWQDEFRATIATADERGFFESAQDATVEFYKALAESVRKYQQQKVEAVLGESLAAARIRKAESWRSARSLRNLKLNVSALESLFSTSVPALSTALLPEDVVKTQTAFTQLNTDLLSLPDDMESMLQSESAYQQLKAVDAGLDNLFETLETALKNTDLYLGFNSLDGD